MRTPSRDPAPSLGALLAARRMITMTKAERVAVAKSGAKARWKGHVKAVPAGRLRIAPLQTPRKG